MATKSAHSTVPVHHRVRTLFASILGILALWLIFASILVVWLNRTLTDTPTYVSTVEPLVKDPAIQTFIVDKATSQLLANAPTEDIAHALLPDRETAGKSFDQLTALVTPVIADDLRSVLTSSQFQSLWVTTNQSAHSQLIAQLKADSSNPVLDLGPSVSGAIQLLKDNPKLAPIADKLTVPAGAGTFNLKGGAIDKAHSYYKLVQQSTLALLGLTLLLIVLAVWISVHHIQTIRRILFGTALSSLLVAGLLAAPSIVKVHTKADPETQAAAIAIARVLFHNLQLACLVIGVTCLVLALVSKMYDGLRHIKA